MLKCDGYRFFPFFYGFVPLLTRLLASLRVRGKTKNMGNIRISIFIVAICLFLVTTGYAQESDGFVVAEGIAQISSDIGLTKDIAILRAKQAAIEQVGIGLKSETIVDMGFVLDDIIKVQTFALIKAYEVINEEHRSGNYWVQIRAWVVPKEEEKPVMENLFAHRSIMVHANGEGSQTIEKKLLARLTNSTYFVLDSSFTKWDPHFNIIIKSEVEFSQKNNHLESYYADVEIRLVKQFDGRLLVSVQEPEDNRIYGLNRRQAITGPGRNGFSQKIAEPMVRKFMQRLDVIAHVREHDVEIVVTGIPNYTVFREEFCRMLRALRLGVKKVFNENYDGGTGRVTVSYAEKTDYLAAMIGFRSQYRVEMVVWDDIRVVYQGG